MVFGLGIVFRGHFRVIWFCLWPPGFSWENPNWATWSLDRAEYPSRYVRYSLTKPFVSVTKISKQEFDEQRNRAYPDVSLLRMPYS
jgi:hypothetical protein